MSYINRAICDRLLADGKRVKLLNTAGFGISRRYFIRGARALRVIPLMLYHAVLVATRSSVSYMALSGGRGQLYDLVFVISSRVFGSHLMLHHHSYAYLNQRRLLTSLIFRLAGNEACHVCLSDSMSGVLKERYGVNKIISLSNSFFIDIEPVSAGKLLPDGKVIKLGFLSNITESKGIHEFLQLIRVLDESGFAIEGEIAGPFESVELKEAVLREVSRSSRLSYIGPVYAGDKMEFFKRIDCLIFPTKYENEAEPVTLIESLSQGVPVIAYGRGAIPELLDESCGFVVAAESGFVDAAAYILRARGLEGLRIWSENSIKRFDALASRARNNWCEVLQEI